MKGNALARLMAGIDDDDDESSSSILTEVKITTLKETYERYAEACTFKPGEFVTPRKGANMKGAGDPHIVLEVLATPVVPLDDAGGTNFGQRHDILIAGYGYGDNSIVSWLVQSWKLERYVAD